ncbi:hypothetical protein B0G38_004600 [Arthrobacter sp. VKM Ac-2550]|nr:hypothetical protein [Arthrobacter sp. VKM Ac-2550]
MYEGVGEGPLLAQRPFPGRNSAPLCGRDRKFSSATVPNGYPIARFKVLFSWTGCLIAELAEKAEAVAASVDTSTAKTFQQARRLVDRALDADAISNRLAVAIDKVIPTVDVDAAEGAV